MCLPCSKQRVITCKTCGVTGHNSRTCGKSPKIPQSEIRAAKSLAALLGPVKRIITCKTCGVAGHNSRTCGKSPTVTMAEKRVAESLAKMLAPKQRVITCKTCGLTGHNSKTCGKPVKPEPVKEVSLRGVSMFKEPKGYYTAYRPTEVKEVSLRGVSMFKEPKGYYTAYRPTEVKQVSLQGVSMFTEPKGYSSVNTKRLAHESRRKITCRKCGCEGHNSRTCSLAPPTSNGIAVVTLSSKRTGATKKLEDHLIEDFNPKVDDMRKYLLEQCQVWGIETE
jgi:hypothetical protein